VSVSRDLLDHMRAQGLVTRRVQRLMSAGGHFRDSLIKLRLFQLTEYERIVYVDADALVRRNLDHLFTLAFDGPIAAPKAYWLPQPFWSSHLLVVKPACDLWERVVRQLGPAAARGRYDMDIVNEEFGREIWTLPDATTCLDSEWEVIGRPGYFPDPVEALDNISVVHFSALGKPWTYSARALHRKRPSAHDAFYRLREDWWRAWNAVYEASPWRVKVRLAWSKRVRRQTAWNKLLARLDRYRLGQRPGHL
jgi:hypothetical protein